MEKETKEKKKKMKTVKLTDEEFADAVLQADQTKLQINVLDFNIQQGKEQVRLNLPTRMAQIEVRQKEEELVRAKLNKKYFDKLVRDKSREVPAE